MSDAPAADLVLLWHHHQPDYRSPREGRALLPWVRLHATKDYLDMALHLERHPGVRVTFNLVPSLLDQLDEAAAGAHDTLFALLAKPVEALNEAERAVVVSRCTQAPRHAFDRWPRYQALSLRATRALGGGPELTPEELLALQCWFLLAWVDPLLLDEPEARQALSRDGQFEPHDRAALLALSDRIAGRVAGAYRALAARGQVELSCSPYDHPILPLVVDARSARRARPDLPLPSELFHAPEDALRQIERGRARHAQVFGAPPNGMWPSEGSVSPEAVALAAKAGVRWLATDEGVLWRSLPNDLRHRRSLYRPWRFATPEGDVMLLFRDHELSDRIGFVYAHWEPREAAADFLARVRRIAAEWEEPGHPVVSVMLDGENCWESYAEDGGPFLEALYGALAAADDIRTITPSDVLGHNHAAPLPELHSGSWIDADFHIWIGHPEKNRGWELLARTRRALVDAGTTPASHPAAWQSLDAAEGSDWFWWFGDDHYTADKGVFDRIFREHLEAAYTHAGATPPAWLEFPITRSTVATGSATAPLGFVHPVLDGRPTHFYEWHAAGRFHVGAGGGSMHRRGGLARDLYVGFDAARCFVRIDFAHGLPGEQVDLTLELLSPRPARVRVKGLMTGERPVQWDDSARAGRPIEGAACHLQTVLEMGIPFAALGLAPGEEVELLVRLFEGGEPLETLPADALVRFTVPDEAYEDWMWSA